MPRPCGDVIKDYFLHYNECLSNDFGRRKKLELMPERHSGLEDHVVETGSLEHRPAAQGRRLSRRARVPRKLQ